MKKRPSEKRIQNWLHLLADKGELHKTIVDTHEMKKLFSVEYEKKHATEFSIDYLIRKKTVIAAQHVLGMLEGAVVMSATKNISQTQGERLFPDLVLFNEEENTIILVEIKRSEKTERETVTELLGYEQEVRNQLPFIAGANLCFLVVSVDFSVLLDHALSNLIVWEKREILSLRVDYLDKKWKLGVYLPDAWEDLRYDGLPSDVITAVDIHIDRKRDSSKPSSHEQVAQMLKEEGEQIQNAVRSIIRDAESARSSGFVIAWLDLIDTESDWGITIGIIDPFRLLHQASQSKAHKNQTPIDKTLDLLPEDARTGLASIRALAKKALALLRPGGEIRFSKTSSWAHRRKRLMGRAHPIEIDFWGTLGEHVREYTANPVIRERVIPEMDAYGLTWRTPTIGIPLLHQITRDSAFVRGNIGASGLFRLGELFGLVLLFCRNFEMLTPRERRITTASLRWLSFDCVAAFREIVFRYTTASDIEQEPPRLQIPMDVDPAAAEKSINEFVRWIFDYFIGKEQPIHGRVFEAAFFSHAFWNPELRPSIPSAQAQELRSRANEFVEEVLRVVFEVLKDESTEVRKPHEQMICEYLEMGHPATLDEILEKVHSVGDAVLAEFGRKCIPRLVDHIFGPVSHQLKPIGTLVADWVWIREQILKMVAEGEKGLAVAITPDGSITIRTYPTFVGIFAAMGVDYEEQVPIFDDLSGYGMMKIFSWSELNSGTAKF